MLIERRLGSFSPDFMVRTFLAWLALSAALFAVHYGNIASYGSMGPDDSLRLVQVRDLINGQSWFDTAQYRIDSANDGVAMHWSRLVDLPLVLVIFALSPLLGVAVAETVAVVSVPLITMGIAMMLAARIAWRLMGQENANFTYLVFAFSIPVVFQLGPMRIDHHGWQIVCILAAVNGLMARSERFGAFIIGTSVAFWLSISIEGLPLAAAFFAILAWRWMRDRKERVWLETAIQSLAGTSFVLFLLTKGFGDLRIYCDAIGPAHLALFGWGAIVLSVLSRIEPIPRSLLLGGFALAGGGAVGIMLFSAPQCVTGGGFAELDPLVAKYWHAKVQEGLPIWHQTFQIALQFAVTPLIGLFATINLMQQSRDWLRRFWTDYALLLCAAFLISLFVARAGAVACVLAAPPVAWQIREWLRKIRLMDRPAYRVSAMVGVACALLPVLPLAVFTSAEKAHASMLGNKPEPKKRTKSECKINETAALLNAIPATELYAALDIGPRILFDTHHSVIATGHHRGNDGMKFIIETAMVSPEEAEQRLRARGTTHVVFCTDLGEPKLYRKASPDGFVARLIGDDAPDWLEPLELGTDGTLKAWVIKPE